MADGAGPSTRYRIRHKLDGSRLSLDLLYDPEMWSGTLSASPPRLRLLEAGVGGTPYEVPWKRIEPGHFAVTRDLDEGAVVRGAIQVGPHALPFGPLTVGSSIEWALNPERISELRAVAAQTGGRELIDLADAWERPPVEHEVTLRLWLILALLALTLLDALMTRTGWRLPLPGMPSFQRAPKPPKPAKIKPTKPKPEPSKSPVVSKPPEVQESARRSRYQRAKDRK